MKKIKLIKKLDNRGFTLVEVTVSFIFCFVLAFSMYELLFNYRTKQNEESIKAELIDYRDEIVLAIQTDITEKTLKSIDYCTGDTDPDRCVILSFNDDSTKRLAVEESTTTYDGDTYDIYVVKYGDIIYESPDAILLDFKSDYMLYSTAEANNATIYRISIPIYHNDLDGNYGINLVAVGYDYTI